MKYDKMDFPSRPLKASICNRMKRENKTIYGVKMGVWEFRFERPNISCSGILNYFYENIMNTHHKLNNPEIEESMDYS